MHGKLHSSSTDGRTVCRSSVPHNKYRAISQNFSLPPTQHVQFTQSPYRHQSGHWVSSLLGSSQWYYCILWWSSTPCSLGCTAKVRWNKCGYMHVVCKGELGCYGAVEEYWHKLRQLKVCIWFTWQQDATISKLLHKVLFAYSWKSPQGLCTLCMATNRHTALASATLHFFFHMDVFLFCVSFFYTSVHLARKCAELLWHFFTLLESVTCSVQATVAGCSVLQSSVWRYANVTQG